MNLIEVKSKQDIAEFHKVPFIIYKDDKNWIPHLKQDVEKVFDPKKNKLFSEGGKVIRWNLKDNNGNLIGRVAAFVNPKTAYTFKQPTGGMGFFECINDEKAAFILFDACKDWLQKQGMEAMDGPINFGEKNMFWGLLVENFTDISSYGMNYNLPYYRNLFEKYGFQTYYEQWMYKRDLSITAQPIFHKKYSQIKDNPDYEVTNIRGKSLEKVADDFREVYNSAWGKHDGFKELSRDTAMKIMKAMKPVLDKDIVVFVYYKKKPIAFWINIPELNQIFRHVNGNLNWLGKLKFLYHKWRHTADIMTGIVFGVAQEFQGKGIEAAMIVWGEHHIVPLNRYKTITITWIGDFNPKMIKVCENLGAERYRTLITYRYLFDRTKPFERCPIIT